MASKVTSYKRNELNYTVEKRTTDGKHTLTSGAIGRGASCSAGVRGVVMLHTTGHELLTIAGDAKALRKLRTSISKAIRGAEEMEAKRQTHRDAAAGGRTAADHRWEMRHNPEYARRHRNSLESQGNSGMMIIDEVAIAARKNGRKPANSQGNSDRTYVVEGKRAGEVKLDPVAFEKAKAKEREAAAPAKDDGSFDLCGSKVKQASIQERIDALKLEQESAAFKATMKGDRHTAAVIMGTAAHQTGQGSAPSDERYFITR
ncbi:MAG: hypothetical protein ACYSW8_26555 [Planctomycetota bacterium]|jgi:hypothetical protein